MTLAVLPNTGFAPHNESIAKHLRQQAEWIEQGECGDVRNVVMVIERCDGTFYRQTMGLPCDLARAIGLLSMAAIRGSVEAQD